jgi:hypothetical protein
MAGVMILISVCAAYGVMTLVSRGGALGELIGIDHEVPIAPFMPVMMLAILFGLSIDYEVFLTSRIREECLKDGDTRRAVADGLAKTARVLTAAAAIMVAVFLAFVASPEVFRKLFGIGLVSAIFLDATVVRMVLVPAAAAARRRARRDCDGAFTGHDSRGQGMGRRTLLSAALAGALLAALGASAVSAATLVPTSGTLSRSDYVRQVEPTCRSGAKATQRAMDGVRDDVRADRLRIAAHKFSRAASIFGGTVSTIARIPRPPAETETLQVWFSHLKHQEGYLNAIAGLLRAGRTIKAQRLLARFIHSGNQANNSILAFGFNYCNFKFSRFG